MEVVTGLGRGNVQRGSEKTTFQESNLLGGLGISVTCSKSSLLLTHFELKVRSELLAEGSTEGKDATLALAVAHFKTCSVTDLPFNSVGDKSGVILVHYEIHNCLIKKGNSVCYSNRYR
jgi:hypothetical protein